MHAKAAKGSEVGKEGIMAGASPHRKGLLLLYSSIIVLNSEAIIPMIITCKKFVTLCCLININYFICHEVLL